MDTRAKHFFLRKLVKQFVQFGIVGVSNTIVSYITYALCVYIGLHYLIGNVAGFLTGTLNSFFWNNKYVFRLEENEKRNGIKAFGKTLLSYAFTGVFLGSIIAVVLVEIVSI